MKGVVLRWPGFRPTLLRTFSVLSMLILALIAVILSQRVQGMVESTALQQETTLAIGQTQTLVQAGLLPRLQTGTLPSTRPLNLTTHLAQDLAQYTRQSMRYNQVVRLKIWNRDGVIVYSDLPSLVGKRVPIDDNLEAVLHGAPSAAEISDLQAPENVTERGLYSHLLEVYVPIPAGPGAAFPVAGVYEVYHSLTLLDAQEATMRRAIWLSMGVGFAVLWASLFLVVRGASIRLVRQDRENTRLLEEAKRGEADATLLVRTGERFRLDHDRSRVLHDVLQAVHSTFGYLSCEVLTYDIASDSLLFSSYTGLLSDGDLSTPVPLGAGIIGRAALQRETVMATDVARDPHYVPGLPGVASAIALPLLAGDQLIGVLNVESAQRNAFGERDLKVLSVLADQIAMAIRNAHLFEQREAAYLTTLDAMARAIDARDPYTAGHSHRVAGYAVAIGMAFALPEEEIVALQRGGMLHDIGKIGVSDAILRKPGPLDAEERAQMERHPVTGHTLLQDMHFLGAALAIVRHHHERWDGRGYPDRLAGEAIPLVARIMAVADAFDTMTSDRPYRAALPLVTARGRLIEGAGSQFWAPAVDALVGLLDSGDLQVAGQPLETTQALSFAV